jgi:2-alkyl-3-oxoalkanoate reductase
MPQVRPEGGPSRVVITGAGGFLGTALTRAFVAAGHRVRATDLPHVDLDVHRRMGAETVGADLNDRIGTARALADMQIVVHAAGLFDLSASQSRLWTVNVEAVQTVCEAASHADRVVHISSTGVYGRCGLDTDEEAPKSASLIYERSKWAGEQRAVETCAARHIPLAVLRPTLIYGEGSRYGLAPTIALFALRRKRGLMTLPIARGGPVGHLVHVDDVAAAAVLVATHPDAAGRSYNVADATPVHAGDLVRALAETSQVPVHSVALPWWTTKVYGPLRPWIARVVAQQNTRMEGAWRRVIRECGLEPALMPRLEMDFIEYVLANHSYDTSRLQGLGFVWSHPDPYVGIGQTGDWYRQQKWIPTFEEACA